MLLLELLRFKQLSRELFFVVKSRKRDQRICLPWDFEMFLGDTWSWMVLKKDFF